MTVKEIINTYSIKSKLTIKQVEMILNNENLRIETISFLRENPNQQFANDFLSLLIYERKKENFELSNSENLMYGSYIVWLKKDVTNSELIWKAKNVDFDMYCGLDVQLIVFAGFEKTIQYFKSLDTIESKKAIEYLKESNEAGDFYDIENYFSPEKKPWWI